LAFAVVVAAQVAESAAVVVVVEVVGIVVDVEVTVTGGPADPESQARGRSGQHYPRQSRSHHPERKKKIFKVTLITSLAYNDMKYTLKCKSKILTQKLKIFTVFLKLLNFITCLFE
jgi:hypothetical protein